jgi:hypothetical protein
MVSKILFCRTASYPSGGQAGMPIVLLALGVITTAAGLLLVGSGLSLRDGSFQTDILTPGTIAAVGGLLLIAFGLAVREMRRIERAFAVQPSVGAVRTDEASAVVIGAAAPVATLAEPRHEPPPLSAATVGPELQPDDAVVERLRAARIPTIPRVENSRLLETSDVAQPLRDNIVFDESAADAKGLAAVARAANGSGSSVRPMPRLDLKPRLAVTPDKAAEKAPDKGKVSVFNSFWPAAKEAPQGAAPARSSQEPRAVGETAPSVVPAPAGGASASTPVSVLKSGVVEGMAYTLYSDGSIEAQLPQGMLRFGSISALRSHIENNP